MPQKPTKIFVASFLIHISQYLIIISFEYSYSSIVPANSIYSFNFFPIISNMLINFPVGVLLIHTSSIPYKQYGE